MESDPIYSLDIAGFCSGALYVPSPHHDERPEEAAISLLVIHNISLPPGEFGGPYIDDLFLGRLDAEAHPYFREIAGLRVSSHFLIRRDGELMQYVPCELRAWHAGASRWKGRERCNDFSIGVELEGADDVPFAEPQYDTLVALTRAIFERYGELDIAGHSDVAPGRKTDPGPFFDWARYRSDLARP
ncbi:MAG TPA: 1,6-anhydro-N-acetylmuramyl-L-alanine amidase AmpD [Usitatibacter sp.]|nr:1,6-anhydro-N-acetylmuramyl-L-alanine amidase AmpD [Usitatibacter sp.]